MADTSAVLASLLESEMILSPASKIDDPVVYTSSLKHRCRFTIVRSASSNILDVLDVARVADIVVFVMNAPDVIDIAPTSSTTNTVAVFQSMIDQTGQNVLSAMRSLGFPALVCAVNGFNGPAADGMSSLVTSVQNSARRVREITRFLEFTVSTDIRIIESTDSSNLTRQLSGMTCSRELSWRGNRSYLLADEVQITDEKFVGNGEYLPEDTVSVVVSGYIRGKPLYVHSLSHICGAGTSRIAKIEVVPIHEAPFSNANRKFSAGTNTAPENLYLADPTRQDSLIMSATGDVLAGEQTWPSEEEMVGGATEGVLDGDLAVGRNRRKIAQTVRAIRA